MLLRDNWEGDRRMVCSETQQTTEEASGMPQMERIRVKKNSCPEENRHQVCVVQSKSQFSAQKEGQPWRSKTSEIHHPPSYVFSFRFSFKNERVECKCWLPKVEF